MDIYVQSRGISQDYCWVKITDKGQQRAEPPLLAQITNLIDSDAASLVLGRFNNALILLVTGLESSQRTDNRNRIIRNSVAWIGQNSDEPVLRAIAVQWLHNELKAKIDKAVKSVGKEGFQVSFKDKELQQLAAKGVKGNSSPVKTNKIGNLQKLKKKLADELTQHRLPEGEGMLVVVTGINTREDFEKAEVWRGLSSLINSEDWELLKNDVKADSESFFKEIGSKLYQFVNGIQPIFLIIILVISLTGNILLYQKLTSEQTQNRTLEHQVETLRNTKNNLKNLEEEFQFKQEQKQKLDAELIIKQKKEETLQNRLQNLQQVLEKQANDLANVLQALKIKSRIEKTK